MLSVILHRMNINLNMTLVSCIFIALTLGQLGTVAGADDGKYFDSIVILHIISRYN